VFASPRKFAKHGNCGMDFSDYLPHLSLVYGHLQRTKKTSLRNEVEDKLPPDFVTDRLQLVHIAVSVPDWRVVITSPLRA
jgi:hypothetical protein